MTPQGVGKGYSIDHKIIVRVFYYFFEKLREDVKYYVGNCD